MVAAAILKNPKSRYLDNGLTDRHKIWHGDTIRHWFESYLTQASLTFKMLFNISLPGWLLIFLLLTHLRPNSCLSDSKTNLPKYTTLHSTPPTLLEILALSLTNILLPPTKLQLFQKPATITFVSFAVSGLTSIPQLPVPLLPLSFTPNLTTVTPSTINSLSLNYPVSSGSRSLLLVLSLKLVSPAISLPSHALSTGSESINASNTSSSLLPTKFSQLPNLHTFITSSLFNVLAVLATVSSEVLGFWFLFFIIFRFWAMR